MQKLIILFISLFLVCGCSGSKTDKYKKIMEENEYVIIDVRTYSEYLEAHIKDAINIPVDEIESSISIDKNVIIFVYCRSGNRSSTARNILRNMGYTVYDLGAFDAIDLPKE